MANNDLKIYSALDIAKWFLLKNNSEILEYEEKNDDFDVYEGITHLKLQKLLYFAQGIYLAINDKLLFDENIIAWKHGPVVKEVYNNYKEYGRDCIPIEILTENECEKINDIENDYAVRETLELTYKHYAIYTAWQLRELSHVDGSPWSETVKNIGMDNIIDNDIIMKYFKENIIE